MYDVLYGDPTARLFFFLEPPTDPHRRVARHRLVPMAPARLGSEHADGPPLVLIVARLAQEPPFGASPALQSRV